MIAVRVHDNITLNRKWDIVHVCPNKEILQTSVHFEEKYVSLKGMKANSIPLSVESNAAFVDSNPSTPNTTLHIINKTAVVSIYKAQLLEDYSDHILVFPCAIVCFPTCDQHLDYLCGANISCNHSTRKRSIPKPSVQPKLFQKFVPNEIGRRL